MLHPTWETEVGGPLVVALLGSAHLFLGLLSTGSALLLPLLLARAHRTGDAPLLGWLERQAGALLVTARVAGVATGAGLWLALAVAQPAGTEALARALLVPFLLQWLGFAVSLAAGFAFARGFGRLAPRDHLAVGGVAAGGALLVLVAGDAALSFMLAPGASFGASGLAGALAAPLLLPSLVFRLSAATGLAAVAVLLGAAREPPPLRVFLARAGALAALPGAVAGPAAAWLLQRLAGDAHLEVISGEVSSAALGFRVGVWAAVLGAGLLAGVTVLAPARPGLVSRPLGVALLACGLAGVGGAELVREAVRKPWLVGSGDRGALWGNGLSPAQAERARAEGLLAHARFSAAAVHGGALDERGRGEEVFRLACRACHTLAGYRPVARRVAGQPPEAIAAALKRIDRLRGRMPPFPGSAEDARALVRYLASLDGMVEGPPAAPPPGDLVKAGRLVLAGRCLICHRDIPLAPRVKGWSMELAYEALGRLPRLNTSMPPFDGTEEERRALAAYLAALGAGQAE